jgi:hypothetical protein
LPNAEPMDYLFFNEELLNNIVIEIKRYTRDKKQSKAKPEVDLE